MVSGRSVSRVKYLISCSLPSSKILKSDLFEIADQRAALVAHGAQDVDQVDVDLDDVAILGGERGHAGEQGQQQDKNSWPHTYNVDVSAGDGVTTKWACPGYEKQIPEPVGFANGHGPLKRDSAQRLDRRE